jgi:hypothetical protein
MASAIRMDKHSLCLPVLGAKSICRITVIPIEEEVYASSFFSGLKIDDKTTLLYNQTNKGQNH